MSDELAPAPQASDPALTEADYAAIGGLLMESARGRWFLAEYARRNRHADTELVLAAVARIESAVSPPPLEAVRRELAEMAAAIARLEAGIAAREPRDEREDEVVRLVRELGGRIEEMTARWAPAAPAEVGMTKALQAAVPAPKSVRVVADVPTPEPVQAVAEPTPVAAKIEAPARPASDADIVWVEAERVRRSAGGLPGPLPQPPAAERIAEIELPEISFVARPPEPGAGPIPAGTPTTDMLVDIFDLGSVPAVSQRAEAEPEPEALPVQEPVSPAEVEALTAAALALLAQAEEAVGEIAAAVSDPAPVVAEPDLAMAMADLAVAEAAPSQAERPVPADPLAPLHALSEDEKIALFG